MIVHYGIGHGDKSFSVPKDTCLARTVRHFHHPTMQWKERKEHQYETAERLSAELRAEGYTSFVTPH